MKNLIFIVLILSVLIYQACSTWPYLNKEEITNMREKNDLYVTVQEKDKYYFAAGNYYIAGDTLYGIGKSITVKSKTESLKIKLCMDDITRFEMRKSSPLLTALLVVGLTSAVIFIAYGSFMYAVTHSPD